MESLKSQRRLERREKWGRWAAAFPEDAARLAADAEWPLQEIPERWAVTAARTAVQIRADDMLVASRGISATRPALAAAAVGFH